MLKIVSKDQSMKAIIPLVKIFIWFATTRQYFLQSSLFLKSMFLKLSYEYQRLLGWKICTDFKLSALIYLTLRIKIIERG